MSDKPLDMRAAVKAEADLLNAMAELASDIAHVRRVHFNAYVSEGFSEAQALELCKVLALR